MSLLRALVLVLPLCLGCAAEQGRGPSEVPKPRVVSLAPALTDIVVALGAAPHLVGVTRWCRAEGVPIVGDLRPRPEAVLEARPDLVLVSTYGSQAPDLAPLESLGFTTHALPLTTLADMRATTTALGKLLGRDGDSLVRAFDTALAEARGRLPKTPPVKVLLVYGVEPGAVISTGGGDHISELLEALGAELVTLTTDRSVTLRLGLDRVLSLAPELILHAAPDATLPESAARAHWARWPAIPAVARGQIQVYPDDDLARNGPHLARTIPKLVAFLQAAREARP